MEIKRTRMRDMGGQARVAKRPSQLFNGAGLEATAENLVKLIGDFHTKGIQFVIEIGRIIEIELVAARRVPDDEVLAVHEIQMNDGQAVVVVHPDGDQRFAGGALGSDCRRGQFDLFVGHALDGDLAGRPAAKRGDDGQSIRTDGDMAMGRWPGSRSDLRLALERRKGLLPQFMKLPLSESKRVWIGQRQQAVIFFRFDQFIGQVGEISPAGGE